MNLQSRIEAALSRPLTKSGADALVAFCALPYVDGWTPEKILLGELSSIFDFGLPLSMLQTAQSFASKRQEIGRAIAKGVRPPAQLLSEVHAAALLAHWGGAVGFVPRAPHPTPDLRVRFDGVDIDIEVVRGDVRHGHKAVQTALASFAGALRPEDIRWHLTGFMIDSSNAAELNDLFRAASNLVAGQFAESSNRWHIRAVPIEERAVVVGPESTEIYAPSWWPKNAPCFFCRSTLIGAAESPVILLRSAIPDAQYTNPILRKATSFQHRESAPFIIACDVSELPRAHERLPLQLSEYFRIWKHVSAVLLFEARFYTGVERKEWCVSMHLNRDAEFSVHDHIGAFPGMSRSSVEFILSDPTNDA